MIALDPRAVANAAPVGPRPATAILFDSDDVRLVVFRLQPGQSVAPHRSTASVVLTVIDGSGTISGDGVERSSTVGDVVCFAPNELHGMRADTSEFQLLATITPRPGSRAPGAR